MKNLTLLTDGITPFVTGGMQRHSANLAKYFTLNGVQVTLIHCVAHDQPLPSDESVNEQLFGADSTVKVFKIITLHFLKPGKLPGHYLRNSYAYSKLAFEQLDFSATDFVYAKGFCGWYYMEQKQKGKQLPPIGVKFHGYEMFQKLPTLRQKMQAKMLQKATIWNNKHADVVFSYGGKITHIITDTVGVAASKVLAFTSGIDTQWVRETEVQKVGAVVKFLFVGRNEKRKGLDELHQAITTLLAQGYQSFEFHFIGPITAEEQLISDSVTYHGELTSKEKMITIIDQMDVLVCPSHAEGMPNVILEGMARGLAVLATDVGAVESLVDNNTGILIPPINEKALLTALQEMIVLDTAALFAMKKAALEKIKNEYLWQQIIQKMIGQLEK